MSKMAELDLTIKENFMQKFRKTAQKKGWDDGSIEFENSVEKILDISVESARSFARYASDIWCNSNCDSVEAIFDAVIDDWNKACLDTCYPTAMVNELC